MSVYRPKYRDSRTGKVKQSRVWWYHFIFSGRHIQESSKSTRKTVATEAEKKRRLALENAFNDTTDRRHERIQTIAELAGEFLEAYKLRSPKSVTFASYALGHVKRLAGATMMIEASDKTVVDYQNVRLRESASPKSINEETGFLLRVLGERGDFIRAKLRRTKMLKLKTTREVARAFSPAEKHRLLTEAKKRRSRAVYPALMLALNAGMRDAEIRGLQWGRVDLEKAVLTVGASKTDAGQGRTIPVNDDLLAALDDYRDWYVEKFGEPRPEWFIFAHGKPQPTDPSRGCTSFKTAWADVRKKAGVTGRWHDNRHTFITDLAESGEASDETIQDLAGHVSKRMLKHYSHIRMEAKRRAVNSLVKKPVNTLSDQNSVGVAKESAKVAVSGR